MFDTTPARPQKLTCSQQCREAQDDRHEWTAVFLVDRAWKGECSRFLPSHLAASKSSAGIVPIKPSSSCSLGVPRLGLLEEDFMNTRVES